MPYDADDSCALRYVTRRLGDTLIEPPYYALRAICTLRPDEDSTVLRLTLLRDERRLGRPAHIETLFAAYRKHESGEHY